MTAKEFLEKFPDLELQRESLNKLGCSYGYISVFDHWLSEEEAEKCDFMSFFIANRRGAIKEYTDGEMKFMEFYRSLADEGGLLNRPRPQSKFESFDEQIREKVLDSLRETKFIDAYFMKFNVRIIGGFDRTDLVIFDSNSDVGGFLGDVNRFKLFFLN